MTDTLWLWLALLAVLGFWALGAYNRIVSLRAAVGSAWLVHDGLIQARQKAIGSLLDAVEPSLQAERAATEGIVSAQVQVATAAEVVRRRPIALHPVEVLAKAEAAMTAALPRLLSLVDQHAELKRQAAVLTPLQALSDLAPRERFSRQAFNAAVGHYNLAIDQFPTRMLAWVFGFGPAGSL